MRDLLPESLRMARMERGLSLRKAAALTGVTKETLSDLERGRRSPHPPTLFKIAQGYGVEVRDLLEPESPKAPAPRESGPLSGGDSEADITALERLLQESDAPPRLHSALHDFTEGATPAAEVVSAFIKPAADIADELEASRIWHHISVLLDEINRTEDAGYKAVLATVRDVAFHVYAMRMMNAKLLRGRERGEEGSEERAQGA
jgi:transcriptional regulator with XRE-family HTH domain